MQTSRLPPLDGEAAAAGGAQGEIISAAFGRPAYDPFLTFFGYDLTRAEAAAGAALILVCLVLAVLRVRRTAERMKAGYQPDSAWFPTLFIVLLDPEIFFYALAALVFSFTPFALLYAAGTSQNASGALAWIGVLLGARHHMARLPPFTLPLFLQILELSGIFLAVALACYTLVRLAHYAAIHAAYRRLSGGSPNVFSAAWAVFSRLPDIFRNLFNFPRAGFSGKFIPQLVMLEGRAPGENFAPARAESNRPADPLSRLEAMSADGGERQPPPSFMIAAGPSGELLGRFLVGILPVWVVCFLMGVVRPGIPDGVGPVIIWLFGGPIAYMLAVVMALSFLDAVYFTAAFARYNGASVSPGPIDWYKPRHLPAPER